MSDATTEHEPIPARLRPMARTFYARSPLVVARELLGAWLVHQLDDVRLVGRIVETEAYARDDPGSHAFRGQTPRNTPMFERPGFAYVYFTYGMHHLLNVVCEPAGEPAAVLIRAVAPLDGVDEMRRRRGNVVDRDLCRGPGRLTQAFGIDASHNRADLCAKPLFIAPGERLPHEAIASGPRVGLGRAQDDRPWRFFEAGSKAVSRFVP